MKSQTKLSDTKQPSWAEEIYAGVHAGSWPVPARQIVHPSSSFPRNRSIRTQRLKQNAK